MKSGLVSVIIPVYNGFPEIQVAIKSLLLQTYRQWECIIINDGSTDDTSLYLRALKDTRFLIFNFPVNKGRPYARQKGLELASGEFIAMLDADDVYHPNKLEYQVKVMNENPDVYLVGGGLCSFGKNIDTLRIRGKGDGKQKLYKNKFSFPAAHAPSLLRRIYAINFSYNLHLLLGQDIDYLKRYLYGKKYIILPNVIYYYSEFDSVSKLKIRSTYKLYIKNFFSAGEFINGLIYIIKYWILLIKYPFISNHKIIQSRGVEPTEEEYEEFNKYCKSLFIESL